MNRRIRLSLNTGYWLAISVIVVNALVTNVNLLRLTENNRRVFHTHEVLGELEHMFSELKDAETSVRGYFLSNRAEHLDTYHAALPEIGLSLDRLRDMTADNPSQAARIRSLRRAVNARLGIIRDTLLAQKEDGLETALESIRAGRGRRAMEDVRGIIRSTVADEERLLVLRSADADATVQRTILGFTITSALAILLLGLIYYLSQRDFAERKQAAETLQFVSRRLMSAQETERRHLARELHDEVGQALTAVKVNLQRMAHAERTAGEPSPVEESTSLIERILGQVRDLSLDLRPSMLDDLGLVAALRWHVDRQTRRADLTGQVIADPPEIAVNPELETTCFRVVQEALTNVIRHARARHVRVELRRDEAGLHLTVSDDGAGFDVASARQRARQGDSFGLLGIEERVDLAGGQVQFQSRLGDGTTIRVDFPLEPAPALSDGVNGQ